MERRGIRNLRDPIRAKGSTECVGCSGKKKFSGKDTFVSQRMLTKPALRFATPVLS